ncbi:tRNA(Ile)-lysidine synthase [Vibrio cholerae]|nr:tRNA(Ile)-lysidine synthase [Vibrio cholerae]
MSPNADQWAQYCQRCCREVGMACQIASPCSACECADTVVTWAAC